MDIYNGDIPTDAKKSADVNVIRDGKLLSFHSDELTSVNTGSGFINQTSAERVNWLGRIDYGDASLWFCIRMLTCVYWREGMRI